MAGSQRQQDHRSGTEHRARVHVAPPPHRTQVQAAAAAVRPALYRPEDPTPGHDDAHGHGATHGFVGAPQAAGVGHAHGPAARNHPDVRDDPGVDGTHLLTLTRGQVETAVPPAIRGPRGDEPGRHGRARIERPGPCPSHGDRLALRRAGSGSEVGGRQGGSRHEAARDTEGDDGPTE